MIGTTLKSRREDLSLDLREVSQSLRIRYEYLKALEDDDFGKFPAEIYAKGFIREYARYLNIDPDPLINEYQQLTARPPEAAPQVEPLQTEKKRSRAPLFIALALALIAAVIPFVTSRPAKEHTPVSRVPEVPKELPVAAAPAPVEQQSHFTLVVTATETAWLRIDLDEGLSEEVLMHAGEERAWDSQIGFTIRLGNAGGVRLSLNDRDLGTPGAKGQVLTLRLPHQEAAPAP